MTTINDNNSEQTRHHPLGFDNLDIHIQHDKDLNVYSYGVKINGILRIVGSKDDNITMTKLFTHFVKPIENNMRANERYHSDLQTLSERD